MMTRRILLKRKRRILLKMRRRILLMMRRSEDRDDGRPGGAPR